MYPKDLAFFGKSFTDDLIFKFQPRGIFIPVGSRLLAARHQNVQSKQEYLGVTWVRIKAAYIKGT